MGVPGSGKSTWAREHMREGDVYVSRDAIRFSMLGEEEEYFTHEDAVYSKFIKEIENGLINGERVIVDATHINWNSRRKLLTNIKNWWKLDIDVYVFMTSLGTCLERNAQRTGRAFVPKSVIRRMDAQLTDPAHDPAIKYRKVVYIYEDGKEKEVLRPHG